MRLPPHPSPLPQGEGEREPIFMLFQIGVQPDSSRRRNSTIHRNQSFRKKEERADLCAVQKLNSTRYFTSALFNYTPRSVPSPSGRGLG